MGGRLDQADIKICLIPLTDWDRLDQIVHDVVDKDTFVILTKQDLTDGSMVEKARNQVAQKARGVWALSCRTGQGVDPFLNDMIGLLKTTFDDAISSPALITQARHRRHLQDCVEALDQFLGKQVSLSLSLSLFRLIHSFIHSHLATPSEEIVLAAEELRQAANALGRITGRVDVEDVLDALFSQFCIGK